MKSAKITLALCAALTAAAATAPAMAQPYRYDEYSRYDDRGDNYYRYHQDWCRKQKKKGQTNGAIIGGIAGAVLGSQVAGNGARTEGSLVGAAAGAAIGSNVGRQSAKARCDDRGAYFGYDDTYDYRGRYYRSGGRYGDGWYEERRCRWAQDWRGDWIRVCPDRYNRFRVVD